MDDVLVVQVVHGQTCLYEHLPDEVVNEGSPILFPDISVEVAMLAELLYDVNRIVINERIVVAYHMMAVKLAHYLNLLKGFERSFFWQQGGVNFFDHIVLVNHQTAGFVLLLKS